jgi:hypothetical protein
VRCQWPVRCDNAGISSRGGRLYCAAHDAQIDREPDLRPRADDAKAPPGWVLVEYEDGEHCCYPVGILTGVMLRNGKTSIASAKGSAAVATPFPELLARIAEAQRG